MNFITHLLFVDFKATTAFFEWSTIWLLLQRDGKVWKEDLRGIYDVSPVHKLPSSAQDSAMMLT